MRVCQVGITLQNFVKHVGRSVNVFDLEKICVREYIKVLSELNIQVNPAGITF